MSDKQLYEMKQNKALYLKTGICDYALLIILSVLCMGGTCYNEFLWANATTTLI